MGVQLLNCRVMIKKASSKAETLRPSNQRRLGIPRDPNSTWGSTPITPQTTSGPTSRPVSRPREEPIPFLQHAHMTFTQDELKAINASIEHGGKANLAKVPSRLQLLRTTILDGTQEPLSMTINRSGQFILSVEEKQAELERADSLISLKGEEDYDPTDSPTPTSRVVEVASLRGSPGTIEAPPVTIQELKTHVWMHSRESREHGDGDKLARQFMGEIGRGGARPAETRGRRKLLSTIHRVSGTYYEPEIPKPDPTQVLNEKIYCAQRLNDYIERRCGMGKLGRRSVIEK